jgi:hypothetical protein
MQVGEVTSSGSTRTTSSFGVLSNSAAWMSSPDIVWQAASGSSHLMLVALDSTNAIAFEDYIYGSGMSNPQWITPVPAKLTAPTATLYSYTPTICSGTYQGNYFIYFAAVANGRLYVAYTTSLPTLSNAPTINSWVQVGTETLTSAPDCAITDPKMMNIVALSSTGSVLLYQGNPQAGGVWAAPKNLGTF